MTSRSSLRLPPENDQWCSPPTFINDVCLACLTKTWITGCQQTPIKHAGYFYEWPKTGTSETSFINKISLISIMISAWIRNYIHVKEWDVVIHPCPNYNGSLNKLLLKLVYGWVIISNIKTMVWLIIHAIISVNTLRPTQNGHHFTDNIFKWISLNENVSISIEISLQFVPQDPINNIPVLVQIMAWWRPGKKPSSEPMMVSLLTHTCVMCHPSSMN